VIKLEIKINKEIRDYTESVFFGLSLRQFIFSLCACLMAIILYFSLRNYVGIETLSWICIMGALPFGALGFVKYNGMNAEELFIAWVKSEILMPKVLLFQAENIYYELLKDEFERIEKEEMKVETISKKSKKRKRKNKDTKKCTTNNSDKKSV